RARRACVFHEPLATTGHGPRTTAAGVRRWLRPVQKTPASVRVPPMTRVGGMASPNSQDPQATVRLGETLLKLGNWLASSRRRARFWQARLTGVMNKVRNARASHAGRETWLSAGNSGEVTSATGRLSRQPTRNVAARTGSAPCRMISGLLIV